MLFSKPHAPLDYECCFGHPTIWLGHPVMLVKGLKCPSPFWYEKLRWLVLTSHYSFLSRSVSSSFVFLLACHIASSSFCTSSSLWWSSSFSFCIFIFLHARRGLLHSPGDLWLFLVVVLLLLRGCDSSSSSSILFLPSLPVRLCLSFFLLHFMRRCGSSSSSPTKK